MKIKNAFYFALRSVYTNFAVKLDKCANITILRPIIDKSYYRKQIEWTLQRN